MKEYTGSSPLCEWRQGNCRVTIYDGAFVKEETPNAAAVMERIARIGLRAADKAVRVVLSETFR